MEDPIREYSISLHAANEMRRRRIDEGQIRLVLSSPDQTIKIVSGRIIYQKRLYEKDKNKEYLHRVIVDPAGKPPVVVTAYRTSKIEKYWRQG